MPKPRYMFILQNNAEMMTDAWKRGIKAMLKLEFGALQMSVLKPLVSRQFRIHVGPSGSSIHGLQNLNSTTTSHKLSGG